MNERQLLEEKLKGRSLQSALRVLRFAEGTERGGPDSYRVMFGGGLAPDLKRHPDKVIRSPGGYASSAAGAYQFLTPSWQSHAKALGLQDFSGYNQDLAAARAIRNRLMPIGGLATLEKEGFSPRVSAALAPEWASLPTESGQSYYDQPVKKLADLQKIYGQQSAPSVDTATQPSKAKPTTKDLAGQDPALLIMAQQLFQPLMTPANTGGSFGSLSTMLSRFGALGK